MSAVEGPKDPNYHKEVQFELLVSVYFRITLFVSAILMAIGIFLYSSSKQTFKFSQISSSPQLIFQEMTSLSPVGLMFIGIVILLLIPLGRVAILLIFYGYNSDYKHMIVSGIVLTFMLVGIIFNIS